MNCEIANFLKMRRTRAKGIISKCIRRRSDANFKLMVALCRKSSNS